MAKSFWALGNTRIYFHSKTHLACLSKCVYALACIWAAFSDYIWPTIEGSCREGVWTVTEVGDAMKRCSMVGKKIQRRDYLQLYDLSSSCLSKALQCHKMTSWEWSEFRTEREKQQWSAFGNFSSAAVLLLWRPEEASSGLVWKQDVGRRTGYLPHAMEPLLSSFA